jgi:branched-chain amino acid transport system ATP-binding protein
MLKVSGIDVFYGDLQVLWDVSFEVREREILVLVGANGAGKSTTLKTISGLLKPRKGSIEFDGVRLDQLSPDRVIGRGVVHVPEARRLFREMSVEENLIMGSLSPEAKKKRYETMEWVYELFPRMKERRKQAAGTLSGGEQQMCAIGRGLMALPKVLMFDEPSLGLSPILVQEVFEIAKRINKEGVTVMLVEQNVRQTLAMCDRAYVLENGRVVLEGTGKNLLNDPHVKEAYLVSDQRGRRTFAPRRGLPLVPPVFPERVPQQRDLDWGIRQCSIPIPAFERRCIRLARPEPGDPIQREWGARPQLPSGWVRPPP